MGVAIAALATPGGVADAVVLTLLAYAASQLGVKPLDPETVHLGGQSSGALVLVVFMCAVLIVLVLDQDAMLNGGLARDRTMVARMKAAVRWLFSAVRLHRGGGTSDGPQPKGDTVGPEVEGVGRSQQTESEECTDQLPTTDSQLEHDARSVGDQEAVPGAEVGDSPGIEGASTSAEVLSAPSANKPPLTEEERVEGTNLAGKPHLSDPEEASQEDKSRRLGEH